MRLLPVNNNRYRPRSRLTVYAYKKDPAGHRVYGFQGVTKRRRHRHNTAWIKANRWGMDVQIRIANFSYCFYIKCIRTERTIIFYYLCYFTVRRANRNVVGVPSPPESRVHPLVGRPWERSARNSCRANVEIWLLFFFSILLYRGTKDRVKETQRIPIFIFSFIIFFFQRYFAAARCRLARDRRAAFVSPFVRLLVYTTGHAIYLQRSSHNIRIVPL